MYVVRNKKTKEIIHMMNSRPGEDLEPKQVLAHFDPETMEFGRYPEQHLPPEFVIEDGVVKSTEKEAVPDLKAIRAQKLVEAQRRSFHERQQLVEDHELLNAALGIYDEARTTQIRETVRAFRDEYKRFEAALDKARTKKDLDALEVHFPTKPVG